MTRGLRALSCALGAAAVLMPAGGCEPEAPEGVGEQGAEGHAVHAGPLDALSRRFGRVRRRMRQRGYEERGSLERTFVLEGDGEDVPLDLPTGVCTTFVALAGGGMRELRLTLYDGEGDEAAVDAIDGEGALVHVCPPRSGQPPAPTAPYYLVMEAREGSGAVVTAEFESIPGEGEGFEQLFEGILAPRVPLRAVEERLAESRAALRARGLLPTGEPRLERVAEGEVIRQPVDFEREQCYAVVARGGEGLRDVDLFLYDPGGAEVGRDLESDAEPSLEHCPDEAGRYIVELRAYEGAGALGSMVLAAPRDAFGAGEPPTEASPKPDAGVAAAPGRQDPIAVLAAITTHLGSRGYESTFVVRDVTITPGEVRTHDVLLGPGCGVVVAAAQAGTDLDLYLSDADGSLVDRDTRVEPTARVHDCLDEALVRRVTVKAYGREGPYALGVLAAPERMRDVQSIRLDEATASLRGRGYEEVGALRATLEEEERYERVLEIEAGQCVAFAAAGDANVEDVDLLVRDADGQLVASESGPAPWAAVTRCAEDAAEILRVAIVLYEGEGEVAITRLVQRPTPRDGASDGTASADGGLPTDASMQAPREAAQP